MCVNSRVSNSLVYPKILLYLILQQTDRQTDTRTHTSIKKWTPREYHILCQMIALLLPNYTLIRIKFWSLCKWFAMGEKKREEKRNNAHTIQLQPVVLNESTGIWTHTRTRHTVVNAHSGIHEVEYGDSRKWVSEMKIKTKRSESYKLHINENNPLSVCMLLALSLFIYFSL